MKANLRRSRNCGILPACAVAAAGGGTRRRWPAPPHPSSTPSSAAPSLQGVSAPTLQSSLVYLCLGLFYTAVHVRRTGLRWRCAWWAYALLAWLDVEANACLVLAYRFTSLTR